MEDVEQLGFDRGGEVQGSDHGSLQGEDPSTRKRSLAGQGC